MDSQVSLNKRRQTNYLQTRGMEELWFANDDIPMNVLSRLPSKTLVGLMLVSKRWNHLLLDRTFARLQLKNIETVCGLFFQQRYQWCDEDINCVSYIPVGRGGTMVYHTVLNFLPENVVIQASCNGLICCRSSFPVLEPLIYVCNPLKKEWTNLQWPDAKKTSSLALAYDPIREPIDVSIKFKVVAVTKVKPGRKECQFLFNIYSSDTGEWRKSKETCKCSHDLFKNKGIFVGGVLYWLTNGDEILMFNPENELPWLISKPLPAIEFTRTPQFCIGDSEGKLHFVLISGRGLQLWMLEDQFASNWELKYSISVDELEQENPQFLYNLAERLASGVIQWVDPLAFKDGILFIRVSINICSFDFDTRKMRKLCSLTDLGSVSMFSSIAIPYTMSLVPVN